MSRIAGGLLRWWCCCCRKLLSCGRRRCTRVRIEADIVHRQPRPGVHLVGVEGELERCGRLIAHHNFAPGLAHVTGHLQQWPRVHLLVGHQASMNVERDPGHIDRLSIGVIVEPHRATFAIGAGKHSRVEDVVGDNVRHDCSISGRQHKEVTGTRSAAESGNKQ